jgi:hypothetical protein
MVASADAHEVGHALHQCAAAVVELIEVRRLVDQDADVLEQRLFFIVRVVLDVAAAEVDRAAACVCDAVEVVDMERDRLGAARDLVGVAVKDGADLTSDRAHRRDWIGDDLIEHRAGALGLVVHEDDLRVALAGRYEVGVAGVGAAGIVFDHRVRWSIVACVHRDARVDRGHAACAAARATFAAAGSANSTHATDATGACASTAAAGLQLTACAAATHRCALHHGLRIAAREDAHAEEDD